MKQLVSTLSGPLLDAAVAKALGLQYRFGACNLNPDQQVCYVDESHDEHAADTSLYGPSIYWDQGGPLLERERIRLEPVDAGGTFIGVEQDAPGWLARQSGGYVNERASTPLVAAMRAYVASKFGAEVDLP